MKIAHLSSYMRSPGGLFFAFFCLLSFSPDVHDHPEKKVSLIYAGNKEWVINETRKNSPDSWYLLSTYDKLPATLNGSLSTGGTIASKKTVATFYYLKGKSKIDLLSDMSTNVHEIGHAYFNLNVFRYTIEHGLKMNWDNSEIFIYISPSESYFISFPRKALFPSKKLASAIPDSLRTFRYSTYISGKSSTQSEGVIGLINELAAYYLGSKYSFDMLQSYKEAEGSDATGFFTWVMHNQSSMSAWYEFDYFIREYLLFMKKNNPGDYQLLKSGKSFVNAYKAVNSSFSKLIKEYSNTINRQIKLVNSSGKAKAVISGKTLWVTPARSDRSRGTTVFSEDRDKLLRVLQSNRYNSLQPDFPSYY